MSTGKGQNESPFLLFYMLRIEFHSHTIFSKDSLTTPEQLLRACTHKGIDRIVITDHNTIRGALAALQLDPQRVILGEEIMTQQGELLAAFVQEEIPPGLPAFEAIHRLREQDAFISVSHPFDRFRSGHWSLSDLQSIAHLVDGLETFNARCLRADFNLQSAKFAEQHQLLGTAGSDAHTTWEVGRAIMQLPEFMDRASFAAAMKQVSFQACLSPAWIHFTSRYAVWYKKLRRLLAAP